MERPSSACVRLGLEEPPGAAFAASGCSTMAHFLSSPLICNGLVKIVWLQDELSPVGREGWLCFSAKGVRDREDAREPGSFAHFLHALPTSCTELRVGALKLASEEELSALCSAIGSPLCTLQHLGLRKVTIRSANNSNNKLAQSLVKALFNNTSLHSLELWTSNEVPAECVIPAFTRTPCSITTLTIHLNSPHTLDDVSAIFTALADNAISLTHLEINNHSQHLSTNDRQLGTMLLTNTSLVSLEVWDFFLLGELVQMLFASLEKNAHLTSLSLRYCHGPDWPSASFVLDSLRVNGMLSRLHLRHTPLHGKSEAAMINAQLARNAKSMEQVAALKSKGSAQVQPTTVRLFLCGLPYSGKTTLSRSLVRWSTGASKWFSWGTSTIERTRGIEVSTIEKDGVKVSLWDMAGQAQYYAFHDHFFPNLSNDASPSFFLFVWNPIQLDLSTGKNIKEEHGKNIVTKTLDMFEHEFKYWLRFLASKTVKSFKFRPKLFVAITRADLLQINTRSWIKNTFNKCQKDFQEHIQFDMDGVFEMNARDPCEAKRLALHIFDCAASLLKSKPLVYQACDQARTVLAQLVNTKPLAPLVTKQDFFFLCKRHLGLDSVEMQEAVALSLNESGDLIYFKSLDLVVIDTRWFCHRIMGNLLYFGNNNKYPCDGFFSLEFLEDLLESSTTLHAHSSSQFKAKRSIFAKATRSPTIKGEALVKLLIGLQLACQQDDNSDIFIPASLCTIPKKKVDPREYLKGADEGNILTFMGRRLKCKDSVCTFFTPGIFSSLQIMFNNIFKEVTLKEDVIAFSRNGMKVLVEFCKHEGRDHFIDVLIHSHLDLDNTIGWAYEEILDKMENVCAQPRGIQGVQIVYEVIRPCSVKEFVCMEERICAAVSVEELCKTLSHSLEKKGIQSDCLESVFYNWQATNDLDRVIDLLGNVETLEVIKGYKQKFILDIEDVLGIKAKKEVCSTSEPDKKFSSSISGTEREWIYDEVRGGHKDIQEVHKELQEVHKEIQKLADDVRKLGHDILPQVRQRVQDLLTFTKEGETGKLPRLFVVTRNDAGLGRTLVAAMVPGLQNVRLELLCEHRSRPHLVAEQRGISFATLEDGLLKQGLPYINMFLKLAGMAVKVGAHLAAGLGDNIPDFSRLLALVVDTPEFRSLPTYLDLQAPGAPRINYHERQKWLFDVLSKFNCCTSTEIHEVFGLTRVRYRDLHVGWLCDKHRSEGELCLV